MFLNKFIKSAPAANRFLSVVSELWFRAISFCISYTYLTMYYDAKIRIIIPAYAIYTYELLLRMDTIFSKSFLIKIRFLLLSFLSLFFIDSLR